MTSFDFLTPPGAFDSATTSNSYDRAAPAVAAGISMRTASFTTRAIFVLPSRDAPPRVFAFTADTLSAAPAGNAGTPATRARAANVNGFGSAAGSGITQSAPTSRFERNSRRWTTIRSPYTRQSMPWRQSPALKRGIIFSASTCQDFFPSEAVFS